MSSKTKSVSFTRREFGRVGGFLGLNKNPNIAGCVGYCFLEQSFRQACQMLDITIGNGLLSYLQTTQQA